VHFVGKKRKAFIISSIYATFFPSDFCQVNEKIFGVKSFDLVFNFP